MGIEVTHRIDRIFKQMLTDLDYAAEIGKDRVEVDWDDLNELLSWAEDVRDHLASEHAE